MQLAYLLVLPPGAPPPKNAVTEPRFMIFRVFGLFGEGGTLAEVEVDDFALPPDVAERWFTEDGIGFAIDLGGGDLVKALS